MIRSIAIGLLVSISSAAFCQHAKMTVSDDFKTSEKGYTDQTITHSIFHNNFFYTATNSGIGGNNKGAFTKLYDLKYIVSISKFDKNEQKLKEVQLQNGERIFGPLAPELILLNNKLCLVYFKTDAKTSFDLYLSLIDEDNLTLKDPKKICSIQQENVGVFKMESVVNGNRVYMTHSGDGAKAFLACKTSANTILTFVLDNQLNIIKQTSLRSGEGIDIGSAVLTNDNVECLVLKNGQDTKIIGIGADGKKTENNLIGSGNLLPFNTNASIAAEGKSIYIYSTTVIGPKDKHCNGLLLSQLDCNTLKLSRPLAYEFTPAFMETVCIKGGGIKHRKEFLVNNFIPDLIEMDNGNLVILGSPEDLSTSVSTRGYGTDVTRTQQVAATTLDIGPVLSFYLSKAGNTFDCIVIPRKLSLAKYASGGPGTVQMVQAPRISRTYGSFCATVLGDQIAILYNDGEKNLTRGEDEKVAEEESSKNLVLAEALINKDKKLEYRKQIGKNLSGRYTYFLGDAVPTSSNSIVFPIGKEGQGFSSRKTFFTNWCFVDVN